jgi:hypothetical protein
MVLVRIEKGMYGLPQAGKIAQDQLIANLAPYGYKPVKRTPGLWRHITKPTKFTLVVDDFGVKYEGVEDANHLINAIKANYKCTVDWTGALYCGITLKWDYDNQTVDLSMPGYVQSALVRFQHPDPYRPEYAPHQWTAPVFGSSKPQLATPTDTAELLPPKDVTIIQQIVGTFLFYARAVDQTMLVALGSIASQQTKATQNTAKAIQKFLNYAATNPTATVRYTASGMCLWVHSDASYLSEPHARSRVGGHFFLSAMPRDHHRGPQASDPPPPNNGAVHTVCNILKNVMASAAEAELGGLYYNATDACPLRTALNEMDHPQPPTPLITDNSTATGIANKTVKQRRSKAIDMRFYWLQDRVEQDEFRIFWERGADNLADYFTKHHPAAYHRAMRSRYLHDPVGARIRQAFLVHKLAQNSAFLCAVTNLHARVC